MRHSSFFVGLSVFLVAACGGESKDPESPKAPPVAVSVAPSPASPSATPPASSSPTPEPSVGGAPLSAALTCDAGRGPTIKAPAFDKEPPPPTAGQMTEQAAQAKRLFDSEKWKDAFLALQRVANGDTGDDEGNKQLAQYHAAIALFRNKQDVEAANAFHAIAIKPNHLKHNETLLWLVKIADSHPENLTLSDFASYNIEIVDKFNNTPQREIYISASYLVGRERLAEGKMEHAKLLFGHVPPDHRLFAAAKKCLATK